MHFQSTKVNIPSAKVYFQSTKVHVQITKVYFQSTTVDFRSTKVYLNLGNRISGIRNLLNTFGSRNPVPTSRNHWNPFLEPRNLGVYPNLGTHRNRFPEPRNLGTGSWNLEPWNLSKPWNLGTSSPGTYPNLGTGSWNLEPNRFPERFPELSRNPPGTFPEPVFSRNRPSSPSTHRNLYCAETP